MQALIEPYQCKPIHLLLQAMTVNQKRSYIPPFIMSHLNLIVCFDFSIPSSCYKYTRIELISFYKLENREGRERI